MQSTLLLDLTVHLYHFFSFCTIYTSSVVIEPLQAFPFLPSDLLVSVSLFLLLSSVFIANGSDYKILYTSYHTQMKFANVNPNHIVGPLGKESGLNWTIMERIWPFTLFTVKVLADNLFLLLTHFLYLVQIFMVWLSIAQISIFGKNNY